MKKHNRNFYWLICFIGAINLIKRLSMRKNVLVGKSLRECYKICFNFEFCVLALGTSWTTYQCQLLKLKFIIFFVNIYYGVRNCTDWAFHRYVHIFSRSHCSLIIVHRSLFIVHWVHWLFTCARRSIIFTKNNKRFRRVEERDLRGAGERK